MTWDDLYRIAAEIATEWRVWIRGGRTKDVRYWKVVKASSEKEALRKGGKNAVKATPLLPTRGWDRIFAEHGRPKGRRR